MTWEGDGLDAPQHHLQARIPAQVALKIWVSRGAISTCLDSLIVSFIIYVRIYICIKKEQFIYQLMPVLWKLNNILSVQEELN